MYTVYYTSLILNDMLYDLMFTCTANAVIFFVFEDIMLVLLTVDLLGKMSYCSLGIKVVSCTIACASTIMRSILDNTHVITLYQHVLLKWYHFGTNFDFSYRTIVGARGRVTQTYNASHCQVAQVTMAQSRYTPTQLS